MFSLNQIHDSAFGGIGDRYARYIDPHHFMGRSPLDDALWSSRKPKSNLKQTEEKYQIELAVPGFKKDEIRVDLQGNRLIVDCKKTDLQDKVPAVIQQEHGYNQISRSFILPENVDQDAIDSKYRNGVLIITLPMVKIVKNPTKLITVK